MRMSQMLVILFYVVATSLGLITIKLSAASGLPITYENNKWALNLNLLSIIGTLLYGLSFMIYFYLISKFDLGYIIPLTTALVYIVIFFASFIIFKESFTAFKILGIGLILIGLFFLNASK